MCSGSPVQTPEPAMDAVLVAIAELKQVKDILNGLLHDDAPAHLPPAASASAAPAAVPSAASATCTSPPPSAAEKK